MRFIVTNIQIKGTRSTKKIIYFMVSMSFNNVLELLKRISDAHKQVKSFGDGEMWDIEGNTKSLGIYPEVWCLPQSTITKLQTQEYTIRLLCYDLVNTDKTNANDVQSDTLLILTDFIKVLKNASDDYTLLGDPVAFPFAERFNDQVWGWYMDVVIEVHFASNFCDLPIDAFQNPGTISGGSMPFQQGVSGFSGINGTSGYSGFSGISGWSGINGASGYSGDDAGLLVLIINSLGL